MELTAARPTSTQQLSYDGIIAVIRRSCRERASAEEFVDLSGVVGVRSGAAPVLWVTPEATPAPLTSLVGRSHEVREIYVDVRNVSCLNELGSRGWRVREVMAHMATCTPGIALAELPAHCTIRSGTETDVPAVRELIGQAFDLPTDVRDASYPDDFLLRAAPVELFVAEDDHSLVGTVSVRRQGAAAMMFGLAVAAPARRQGLSRSLVNRGVAAAVSGGAGLVHALTADVTTDLAEGMGWVRVANWVNLVRE